MALTPGTRIGSFEIAEQIGVGGMGEVYRATDVKLARQVAIKVLPDAVASDAERLARFDREARTLASLNHPHIAAIYGLEDAEGAKALVMELVEGPTLADRIAQGPIPVDEALPIARQIAEALEAAHEQGIIHRDLKPANVKVRPDGTVKVLDFGLAKAMETTATSLPGSSIAPTITTPAHTMQGAILGTAAYMSPEQARGKAVDRRADTWAFACVLYEMLTGRRPFEGEDVTDTVAAVVRGEPNWDNLPSGVPPHVRHLLHTCLRKDPRQRVADAQDLRLALDGAFETRVSAEAPTAVHPSAWSGQPRWRVVAAGAATAVVLVAAGWAIAVASRPAAPATSVRRFPLVLPSGQSMPAGQGTLVALSPDGQTLVYRALDADGWRLYQRRLDQVAATPIPGTEGADDTPFFSPDGQWLAFGTEGDSELMRVSLTGGQPVLVASNVTDWRGGTWGEDGTIVLGLNTRGLGRVSANGGEVTTMTTPEDDRSLWYPQLLPGGATLLYTASEASPDTGDVMLLDIATGQAETVITGGVAGHHTPTGHLVFLRGGDLWAVRFDIDTLTTRGEPALVEQGIRVEGGGAMQFSVADDGSLAYLPPGGSSTTRVLVWVDREGVEESLGLEPDAYADPVVSPDGERLAVKVESPDNMDVWVWSFARRTRTRLTFEPASQRYMLWTPDSARIVYEWQNEGLFWRPADGTGAAEQLLPFGDGVSEMFPASWTLDGELIFAEQARNWRIGHLPMEDGAQPEPLLSNEFSQRRAAVSPDGRWLAYESNLSGAYEIYVRPFPDLEAGIWQVSAGGGEEPEWSTDGRTLFYRNSSDLMEVAVETEGAFSSGTATRVIGLQDYLVLNDLRHYDVSADGERFLMIKAADDESEAGPQEVVVVQNWFSELERLVPTE